MLRGLFALAACLLALIASAPSAMAKDCYPAFSVEMKVRDDRPYIDLTVNNHPVSAFVDTGAGPNALRYETQVEALGMKSIGQSEPIHTAAGPVVRTPLYEGRVVVGAQDLGKSRFLQDFRSVASQGIVMLGLDALSRYSLAYDHKEGRFSGYDPKDCRTSDAVDTGAVRFDLPKLYSGREVTVSVSGFKVSGILDTGSQTIVISRRIAHLIGVTDKDLAVAPHHNNLGLGGTTVMDSVIDVHIQLAGRNFGVQSTTVRDMPQDMLVGEPLLKNFDIFLPAHTREVYLTSKLYRRS